LFSSHRLSIEHTNNAKQQINNTNVMFSLKTIHPSGIRTRVFCPGRMRCLQHHDARNGRNFLSLWLHTYVGVIHICDVFTHVRHIDPILRAKPQPKD
jgi:hypothetical protein